MSDPLYYVGQAVMVRSNSNPEDNRDFAIVTKRINATGINSKTRKITKGWKYLTHNDCFEILTAGVLYNSEDELRPIPPEKQNGIDASEYIKNLTGVPV